MKYDAQPIPGMGEHRTEWPVAKISSDTAEPLLPLVLSDHVELIRAGGAVEAFARKRAVQMLTHGHTPERDLEKTPAQIAHEIKHRLDAFTEIMPFGRMNLPPLTRERCIRYVEIAGGILIALWDRCQVEVPE